MSSDTTAEEAEIAQADDTSERIIAEISYLRDLFVRRLSEDKVRERAFDELYRQLEFSRDGLIRQALTPVVEDALLLCDRIQDYAQESPHVSEVMGSIAEELLEMFFRRGLTEIDAQGDFDAGRHEVIQTVPVDSPSQDKAIVECLRRGFAFGDTIVRPAGVLLGVYAERRQTGRGTAAAIGEAQPSEDSVHQHSGRRTGGE